MLISISYESVTKGIEKLFSFLFQLEFSKGFKNSPSSPPLLRLFFYFRGLHALHLKFQELRRRQQTYLILVALRWFQHPSMKINHLHFSNVSSRKIWTSLRLFCRVWKVLISPKVRGVLGNKNENYIYPQRIYIHPFLRIKTGKNIFGKWKVCIYKRPFQAFLAYSSIGWVTDFYQRGTSRFLFYKQG